MFMCKFDSFSISPTTAQHLNESKINSTKILLGMFGAVRIAVTWTDSSANLLTLLFLK